MMERTINNARNPKWADYAQTAINIEVDFDELDEEYVPFTAISDDTEAHGRTIYENAVNGDYGEIAAFEAPPSITGDEAMAEIRAHRDYLLKQTDYIEMPTKWASLSAAQQTAWTEYRNALRNIPQDYPNAEYRWVLENADYDLVNITWPTKPE